MTKRDRVFAKYNGKCAYTGKPLGSDWQIDHIDPICRYSPRSEEGKKKYREYCKYANRIENLLPALRIVNHYKHSYSLDYFRKLISSLQSRIDKLPKYAKFHSKFPPEIKRPEFTERQARQINRAEYLRKVAEAFGITHETPFCGKFYFERIDGGIR